MTLLDDMGCALFGCRSVSDPVLQNVALRMKAVADVSCDAKQVIVQDTACSVIAKSCPDLSVTCVNNATQSASCDMAHLASAAAQALMSYADRDGLCKALGVAPAAGDTVLEKSIETFVHTSCGSQSDISQQITNDVICKYSKDVNISALANADQSTACATTATLGLAYDAQRNRPGDMDPTTRGRILVAAVIVVYILLLVGLVLWIRSMGGAPLPVRIMRA